MRILIIEDEESLADLVATRLKKEKYTVDVSYDGEDGLYTKVNSYTNGEEVAYSDSSNNGMRNNKTSSNKKDISSTLLKALIIEITILVLFLIGVGIDTTINKKRLG